MNNDICLLGCLGVKLLVSASPSGPVEDDVDSDPGVTCLAAWFTKMVSKSLTSNIISFISLSSFGGLEPYPVLGVVAETRDVTLSSST